MGQLDGDWSSLLSPETGILELIVRGSIAYLLVVVLMRMMLRRSAGELAMLDLVFVLLVAQALGPSMTVENTSLLGGFVIVATIMAWNYLLNSLSFSIPLVEKLVSPSPLQVVRDGQLLRRNMRREFLTEQELLAHLREEGLEGFSDVKAAYVEGDGRISVLPNEPRN